MASLGYNVALHRTLAFGVGSFIAAVAGVLYAWWFGQLSPTTMGLDATIQLLIIAVIGGLRRIEGAWLGALAFIWINNEATNRIPSDGLPVIGGSLQHDHRFRLPRHRHRLARRPDGALGSDLGRCPPPWRPAAGAQRSPTAGDGTDHVIGGWIQQETT